MVNNGAHEPFMGHDDAKIGSERGFGALFAAVFVGIGLWPAIEWGWLPRLNAGLVRYWALAVGAFLLAAGLWFPGSLRPLNVFWFRLGLLLGRLINPIVLGILFFAVFTPFGVLMRLFGADPLRLRLDRGARSYWIRREPSGPSGDTMKHQY